MKNLKIILILTLITMIFITSISNAQQSFPLKFRKDDNEINYLYNIEVKKIVEENEFFKGQINYPYLQIKEKYKDKKENIKVLNKINSEIYEYVINFKNSIKKQSQDYEKEYKGKNNIDLPKFVYEAYSEYEVTYNSNNLISIPILTYEFTGGAHGMSVLKSFNYNLKDGNELTLSQIFKEKVDYKSIINNYIQKEIDKNKDLYFQGENGFKGIDNNQGFYLESDKLVIYFQLYEIAPYYVGIPKFEIPLKDIANVINI